MPRPSAAEAIYGHLPCQSGYVAKQQDKATLARAMYPSLVKPEPNPRDAWREYLLQSIGLRKVGTR